MILPDHDLNPVYNRYDVYPVPISARRQEWSDLDFTVNAHFVHRLTNLLINLYTG